MQTYSFSFYYVWSSVSELVSHLWVLPFGNHLSLWRWFLQGGGKAELFDHTDVSPYELSPHNLEKSPGMGNLGKRLNQLGVELRSIELLKSFSFICDTENPWTYTLGCRRRRYQKKEEADEYNSIVSRYTPEAKNDVCSDLSGAVNTWLVTTRNALHGTCPVLTVVAGLNLVWAPEPFTL